jgi:hypothetical protein
LLAPLRIISLALEIFTFSPALRATAESAKAGARRTDSSAITMAAILKGSITSADEEFDIGNKKLSDLWGSRKAADDQGLR